MTMEIRSEQGTTLIETVVACAILLVVLIGLMSMAALATMYTQNHGHLEARTAEYAQDKLEQLLALAYTDVTSDTAYFPANAFAGTGMTVGGSLLVTAPVDGYTDWLTANGDLLHGGATPPANWFYQRVWQITSPSNGMKQITVTTTVRTAVGGAMIPRSTVVVLRSSRF